MIKSSTFFLRTLSLLVLMIIVVVFMMSSSSVYTMEHHKFKKCHEKGFCNRLRSSSHNTINDATKSTHYTIASTSVNEEYTQFTAKLVDNRSSWHDDLLLVVNVYENHIFRLRVREWTEGGLVDKVNKRYEVQDVIMPHVNPQAFTTTTTDDENSKQVKKLVMGNVELELNYGDDQQPFSLTLKVGGQEAIVINGNSLLNVESNFVKEREDAAWKAYEEEKNKNKEKQSDETTTAGTEEEQADGDQNKNEEQDQPRRYEGETAVGIDFSFPGAKHVYGIPERATNLALKSTKADNIGNAEPYRMFNLDVFEYELDNPLGLYGIIPLLYSLKKGLAAGILVMNPSESFVDIEHQQSYTNAHWISETGIIDVYLLPGPSPATIVQQYSYLTGYNTLPQQFALAYHQCRWNYKDEDDVAMVDSKFDEHNIPMDVVWLDIEHTDGKKYFTWDKQLFPTPQNMQNKLAGKGRKMVTISDPHIKREPGYFVHDEATKNGYYVKKSDGSDYEGHCWPGSSSWLDYFNPEVRKFYSNLYKFDRYVGSTPNLYTWIDMNEPSVFSGPEVTMDKDAIHYGGLTHGEVHNLYGFYQGMATYQGHIERRAGQDRPFILSRSFFAGSQRYVAIWTGDNAALWTHLDAAQPMILAFGISGLSFVGADVGGFFGNPSTELLVRWYQAGAFYPFFRAHAHIETQRREPWLFGEDNMNIIRAAIQRRYTLLPYYYTLAFHASVNAAPIMRPLFFDYPEDERTYDIQDQFLIGSSLLVKPVVDQKTESLQVYLPGGSFAVWYDYEDFTAHKAGMVTVATPFNKIPVFQRGGTIIPTKMRMRRASSLMTDDPYTLRIALNQFQEAFGDLYVDDGHTFNYRNGQYAYMSMSFTQNVLSVVRGDVDSVIKDNNSGRAPPAKSYTIPNTIERLIIAGYPHKPKKVTLVLHADETASVASPEAIELRTELEFTYDASVKKLVVRKPMVRLDSKWSIIFL